MAAPTFVKAGTGSTDATGAWSHTGPAPAAVGNLLICQILVDGTAAGTPTITSTTNIESLSGTANQWTAAPGNPYAVGSPTAAGQLIFFARATSTSAPVITGANSGGDDVYVRIYEFATVNTGTTLADIVENSTAGTLSNGVGTSTTISDTGVTTLGPDRLALQLVGANDDIAIDAFAGETGGDWTEAVAEYAESSGTDAALQLQIAALTTSDLDYLTLSGSDTAFQIGALNSARESAQGFVAAGATVRVDIRLKRTNSPADNVIVEIQTDSSGSPSGTVIGTSASMAASGVSTAADGATYSFTVAAPTVPGTSYWIVVRRSGALDNLLYVSVLGSSSGSYAGGAPKINNAGAWGSSLGSEFRFATFANKAGTINGGSDTVVSAGWGVVGFALIGTTPSGPATVERSAAISATAAVTVPAYQRERLRSAAVSATAEVAVSGAKVTAHSRSAAISATAGIASSATFFSIFERAAAVSATAAISTVATFFSIFERALALAANAAISSSGISVVSGSATVSATAGIATSGISVVSGSATVSATAAISTSGISVVSGAAAISATGAVSVSGVIVGGADEFERAASLAATASIATSGISVVSGSASLAATASIASSATFLSVFSRTAAVSATAGISSVPRRDLLRSIAASASAEIASSGTFFTTFERSSATSATGAVTVSAIRDLPRSASLAASATITTDHERVLLRSTSLVGIANIASDGSAIPPGIIASSAHISATAGIAVSGVATHFHSRAASFNATAGIAVSGQISGAVERSATLTASATISISGAVVAIWVRSVALDAVALVDASGLVPPLVPFEFPTGRAPVIAGSSQPRIETAGVTGRIQESDRVLVEV